MRRVRHWPDRPTQIKDELMTTIPVTNRFYGFAQALLRREFRRKRASHIDHLPDRLLADIGLEPDGQRREPLPPEIEALRYSG
jgi:hypothetical protein